MGNTDKRYEVIISDKPSEMLITHVRFLMQVSEEAAQEVAERFTSSASLLEYFPERNPWLTDISLPKMDTPIYTVSTASEEGR